MPKGTLCSALLCGLWKCKPAQTSGLGPPPLKRCPDTTVTQQSRVSAIRAVFLPGERPPACILVPGKTSAAFQAGRRSKSAPL